MSRRSFDLVSGIKSLYQVAARIYSVSAASRDPAPATPSCSESSRSVAASILLIDGDRQFSEHVAGHLAAAGHRVGAAGTGPSGLRRALSEPWEVVVLAVALPDTDGLGVLKRLRQSSDVPILLLGTHPAEANLLAGLEGGADGYLLRSMSASLLLARVHAVTRRCSRAPTGRRDGVAKIEPVDPDRRQAVPPRGGRL